MNLELLQLMLLWDCKFADPCKPDHFHHGNVHCKMEGVAQCHVNRPCIYMYSYAHMYIRTYYLSIVLYDLAGTVCSLFLKQPFGKFTGPTQCV